MSKTQNSDTGKFVIAIHGGAGPIRRSNMSPEKEKQYLTAMELALGHGKHILSVGGTALDAVEACLKSMEDCPLFNAGRGSVFAGSGKQEMEASLMCGKSLNAGAVAGLTGVRNPVSLARVVMDRTDHVFISGPGAIHLAKQFDLQFEEEQWFYTEQRYRQFIQSRTEGGVKLDHQELPKGTVGAVALDLYGDLAAATSTGGMTNKMQGRIGDSPMIGVGTYANNQTCAVSGTGHGEYFIKGVVAYDVSCLMEYKGLNLTEACEEVIYIKQKKLGGTGGLIAIDTKGNISMPFNSEGMYRASLVQGEDANFGIYSELH